MTNTPSMFAPSPWFVYQGHDEVCASCNRAIVRGQLVGEFDSDLVHLDCYDAEMEDRAHD